MLIFILLFMDVIKVDLKLYINVENAIHIMLVLCNIISVVIISEKLPNLH